MDGILEELLRLESVKNQALRTLNSDVYEDSVQQQNALIDNPGFSASDRAGSGNLLAFSKLAGINTTLYENLLSTAPWLEMERSGYSGQGYRTDVPAAHGFSLEA